MSASAESELTGLPPLAMRRPALAELRLGPDDQLLERAFKWEAERPDEAFMVQPLGGGAVRELTWAQTMDEARRMAAYLRSLGFPPGTSIAILSKNCAHFIMMDLAIWMAGHVSVALYPTLSAGTIRYILEHCDARLLFVGKLDDWAAQAEGVPAGVAKLRCVLSPPTGDPGWEQIIQDHKPLAGRPSRRPEERALLMYTSGSTGTPKGVEHDFYALAVSATGFHRGVGFRQHERVISYLPLAHAFERAVIESAGLIFGFKIYFAESLDTFVQDIRRARPTIFQSVPRLWLKFRDGVQAKVPAQKLKRLLKIPLLGRLVKKKVLRGLGLDRTWVAITGSAPVPAELLQWYHDLGLELIEGYAMTENFSYSHFARPGKTKVGTVGVTAPDVEFRLGEGGEIEVKSPATMVGYYREPEMTAATFTRDGFLKTGDRGSVDKAGNLTITGRVKELFKTSKAKYIAPAPIENALNATGLIEQSCVMGSGEPQPFAVVMLTESVRQRLARDAAARSEIEAQIGELYARVNASVEEWERLGFVSVVAEEWTVANGLLTPSLKIKRAAIEERYGGAVKSGSGPVRWYSA